MVLSDGTKYPCLQIFVSYFLYYGTSVYCLHQRLLIDYYLRRLLLYYKQPFMQVCNLHAAQLVQNFMLFAGIVYYGTSTCL
jgi:hypothetical protein